MEPLHDLLRRASTRPTAEPEWDPDAAADSPWPLAESWLRAAVEDGVLAAATAVLATATTGGTPSARTVLLQDVTEDGAWVAVGAESPAGRQLAANPAAALVLHLREHARQIRLSGPVSRGDAERSAAAFRARGARSRAVTVAGEQSAPLPPDWSALVEDALAAQQSDDPPVDPRWTAYLVAPDEVEFWQSRHGSGETRLRYRRTPDGWARERLWP